MVADPVHGCDPIRVRALRRGASDAVSTDPSARRPAAVLVAARSGIPKVSRERLGVDDVLDGPAATTWPSRSSSAWVKPGGISSTWWETRTVAGEAGSTASTDRVETRSSRPPRSSPAAGSSRSSSSGSVISARAIWTRLRSPSLRVPKVRSGRRLAPTSSSRRGGALVVEVVVLLAPAPDDAVGRRDDDVLDQLVARDPLRQRGAGQADARAQLEDVDGAEHLVEDAGDAGRGVDLGGGDLQQRGLAGAVGAEHDPALVLLDRPRDRVEQRRLAAAHGHLGELEDGGHGRTLSRLPPSWPRRSPRLRPDGLVAHRLAARATAAPTTSSTRSGPTTRAQRDRPGGRAVATGAGPRAAAHRRAPARRAGTARPTATRSASAAPATSTPRPWRPARRSGGGRRARAGAAPGGSAAWLGDEARRRRPLADVGEADRSLRGGVSEPRPRWPRSTWPAGDPRWPTS